MLLLIYSKFLQQVIINGDSVGRKDLWLQSVLLQIFRELWLKTVPVSLQEANSRENRVSQLM